MRVSFKFKAVIILVFTLWAKQFLFANEVALVYQDEAAVQSGQFFIGMRSGGQLIVPAKDALSLKPSFLIGLESGDVFQGSLSKIDFESQVGTLKIGNVISTSTTLSHLRWIKPFITLSSTAAVQSQEAEKPNVAPVISGGIFDIKINGELVDIQNPTILNVKKKESACTLELVYKSSEPTWGASLILESEPSLSFWKKPNQKSLNDVPRKRLMYDYQALFRQLKQGESFKIPIEIFFINQEIYRWKIQVKTKKGQFEQSFGVRFKPS